MSVLNNYVSLLRPQQWIKNGFVLLPIFFGGKLMDLHTFRSAIIAFFAFSLAASAVYCLNDVVDYEADRKHPKKCHRPVASGAVSKPNAIILMTFLAAAALALCMGSGSWAAVFTIAIYLILNVAYCLKLKQVPILDVFIVSAGFVLRVVTGGVMCGIWLSPWLMCMTFLLSLFLAFAKRRDDVVLYEDYGIVTRKNILSYNLDFLNQTLGILASITMVCYLIYTLTPEVMARFNNQYVYITAIFVLAGILRYLQVAIVQKGSGSPTKVVMHDRFLQCCVVLWFITFGIIIYEP